MELREAVDELYGSAPGDFVATRTRLAKQARADGDRELAAGIAALRKPTVAAWLLNALSREQPDAVAQLRRVGDELRSAQSRLDGSAMRDLSARRREAQDAAMREVGRLARERGQPVGDAVRAELDASFSAAVLDEDSGAQLAAGALSGALEPPAFGGALPAGGDASGDAAGRPARPAGGRRLRAVPDPPDAAQLRRRSAAVARAEAASAALSRAREDADAAQARVDRLHEQIEQLREELAEAAADARAAHEAQRRAEREASAALRRLDG